MTNISITHDTVTGFFDACILDAGIATQAKSLDECVVNLSEALSLSQERTIELKNFNISFEDNHVNI